MPEEHSAEEHERRDFQPGALLRSGVVFILALAAAGAIPMIEEVMFTGLPPNFSPLPPVLSAAPGVFSPPAPQLEAVPGQSLQPLRAHEAEVLGSYGWVDQ